MLESYCARYGISETEAYEELLELGFQDGLRIEISEKQGIAWKYMIEPRSGDMLVVPDDTEEWELYPWHNSG